MACFCVPGCQYAAKCLEFLLVLVDDRNGQKAVLCFGGKERQDRHRVVLLSYIHSYLILLYLALSVPLIIDCVALSQTPRMVDIEPSEHVMSSFPT